MTKQYSYFFSRTAVTLLEGIRSPVIGVIFKRIPRRRLGRTEPLLQELLKRNRLLDGEEKQLDVDLGSSVRHRRLQVVSRGFAETVRHLFGNVPRRRKDATVLVLEVEQELFEPSKPGKEVKEQRILRLTWSQERMSPSCNMLRELNNVNRPTIS